MHRTQPMARRAGRPSAFPLLPETVQIMTRPARLATEIADVRGVGWDIHRYYSSLRGNLFGPCSFGQIDATGTLIWIDPDWQGSSGGAPGACVSLLTNRVYLNGHGTIASFRRDVPTGAAGAFR